MQNFCGGGGGGGGAAAGAAAAAAAAAVAVAVAAAVAVAGIHCYSMGCTNQLTTIKNNEKHLCKIIHYSTI